MAVRNIFAAAHLRGNTDSQARQAYMLHQEGCSPAQIAAYFKKLGVTPSASVADLIALGERLMPARRKHG